MQISPEQVSNGVSESMPGAEYIKEPLGPEEGEVSVGFGVAYGDYGKANRPDQRFHVNKTSDFAQRIGCGNRVRSFNYQS